MRGDVNVYLDETLKSFKEILTTEDYDKFHGLFISLLTSDDNNKELISDIRLSLSELDLKKLNITDFDLFVKRIDEKYDDLFVLIKENRTEFKSDIKDGNNLLTERVDKLSDDLKANNNLLQTFFKELTIVKNKGMYLMGGVLLVGITLGNITNSKVDILDLLLK